MSRQRWFAFVWYAAVATLTVGYLAFHFRLHHAQFTAPLCPVQSDSAALLSLVKNIDESGWPWIVERSGAPGKAERYDYPLPEHTHYLTIRALLWLTGDVFAAFNLWGLLSYPLTAVCTYAVMRAMKIVEPLALALAILYTFLPYHSGRVFSHTMLAYYHTVPLILLPTLWIIQGRLPFFRPTEIDDRQRPSLFNATTGITLLLGIIVATTSPYYAFFGCYCLVVAGLYRGLSVRSWRPVASALATAVFVVAIGFACALPFMLEQRQHGANPAVAQRHPNEADVYSLKVTQLVLPLSSHRIGALGHITRHYQAEAIHANENRDSVLGFVGVAGFLILIGRLLTARGGATLLGGLAVLNVAVLVLGASGGLGGLFNYLVYPQIRCYNRLCIFVAFWCLLAVGILLDRWAVRGSWRRAWLAAIPLLGLGLLDLTTQRQAPHHSKLQADHQQWSAFVGEMEASLPEGAMIFQLPTASYPEAGPIGKMPDYSHLACHPYSQSLRFSYGTNRNRRWDDWHQYVAELSTDKMIRALCLAGFDAVYIDRRGYGGGKVEKVEELRAGLGGEFLASPSGDQLVFGLADVTETLRRTMAEADWVRERERLLNRPCLLLQDGFRRWSERDPERVAMHSTAIRLVNPGAQPREVTLRWQWRKAIGDEVIVHVASPTLDIDRHEPLAGEGSQFTLTVALPPGEHVIRFETSPKPLGLGKMYNAWIAWGISFDAGDGGPR